MLHPSRCSIPAEFIILLALVLLNGLFSGAEIAVVSIRKSRLHELVDAGSRSARAVKALRDDPERFFATVQIVITVVGATAGAFGGSTFAVHLKPLVARLPLVGERAEAVSLAIVVAIISYLSLVLGELVPKSLALRTAEGFSLLIGRPLVALAWVARPLVWLLTKSSNAVLRIFGDSTSFVESRLSSNELQLLVDEAAKVGSVHPQAGEIASRAIEFGDLQAKDVMVARPHIIGLPRNARPEEIKRVLLEEGHSRMPIYEDTLDNVVGYVSIKDIIAVAWEGDLIKLDDIIRPAWFVPETMRAVDLLREIQRRRTHLVIVVDEAGATAGIITTEDLIEELVGDIVSEQDDPIPDAIRREPDGSLIVHGTVPIRDLNREPSLDLPESEGYSTLAGLCNALAGHIPQKGEQMTTPDGTALEVVDANARRVRLVRLRPKASEPGKADEPGEPQQAVHRADKPPRE